MAELDRKESVKIKKGFWTPKRVARIAILIALSAVGAFIKIPSPTGTVALDASAGFFTAVAFGPIDGAIVGGLGHLFTAATTGFPLGLPLHLYVALQMVLWAVIFWFVATKINLWVGVVVAILCNGVISAALLIPIGGTGMFVAMVVPLLVGSAVNVIVAALAYRIVKKSNLI